MSGRKKKIMIVDDDPGIVDSLTILLEEFGYEVTSTVDASTVKDTLKEKPDLILLDIWMSGWDGRDVCKYLKGNEDTKNLPVIIISANKDIVYIAKEAGADDYITKPFQIEDLLAKVEKYLGENKKNNS